MHSHRWIAPLVFSLAAVGCTAPNGLENYLDNAARHFSPGAHMVGSKFEGPTYHTQIAPGTWVHSTLASLDYALALLHRDAGGDRERAQRILARVIALQEKRAGHEYYGVWPWFLEEPIGSMNPPDRNWADFCGARLAQILVEHGSKLDPELRGETRQSLGHAGRAIRERDVDPSYTNIAIMGAVVAAVAGEELREPGLLVYGRKKLEQVLAHTAGTSDFGEYNSPNYTMVVLWECERALHLVSDAATRTAAEQLRRTAWRTMAESFHAATSQWAGPHSRTYHDRLSQGLVRELSDRTGIELPVHPEHGEGELYPFWTTPQLPCPEELVDRFLTPPASPREVRRTFRLADDEGDEVFGTTWMAPDVCLGSVNRASLWTQRRPLIGYWRTAEDPAVVFRLRALKNGRDFAAIGVRSQQHGPRVTSRFHVLRERGDWHRHLDKPEDSTYRTGDLRIRYELRGRGVTATKLGDRRFELRAGEHRVLLHTTAGTFAGRPVEFRVGEGKGIAFFDVVLHDGAEESFDFRDVDIDGVGVEAEILRGDQTYEVGTVSQYPAPTK